MLSRLRQLPYAAIPKLFPSGLHVRMLSVVLTVLHMGIFFIRDYISGYSNPIKDCSYQGEHLKSHMVPAPGPLPSLKGLEVWIGLDRGKLEVPNN